MDSHTLEHVDPFLKQHESYSIHHIKNFETRRRLLLLAPASLSIIHSRVSPEARTDCMSDHNTQSSIRIVAYHTPVITAIANMILVGRLTFPQIWRWSMIQSPVARAFASKSYPLRRDVSTSLTKRLKLDLNSRFQVEIECIAHL